MKKSGFTLVELSIVLVIIGLLIGGILVAQSLIDSARTNSIVREIQQIKIKVRLFEERYKGLPGDHRKAREFFGTSTYSGNGDGTLCRYESAQFWQHLFLGGFIEESMTGTIINPVSCAVLNYTMASGVRSYPSKALDGNFTTTDGPAYMPNSHNLYRSGDTRMKLALARFNAGIAASAVGYSLFTPAEALAIDQKMDDGQPHTGDVYGAATNDNGGQGANACTSFYAWGASPPAGNVTYTVANDNKLCLLSIAIIE